MLHSHGIELIPGEPILISTNGCIRSIEVRPSGTVRLNKKDILHLDFGNRWALCDLARRSIARKKVIALWSHKFLGYYHWIVDVLPKICRLKSALGAEFDKCVLCYPRSRQPYEIESLAHLGISESQIIDTSSGINLSTEMVWAIAAPGWHCGSPNIAFLREYFVPEPSHPASRKLYLSRSSGRRRICTNDRETFKILEPHGFEFIEEKPRTLNEQIELFATAEAVVSPHGGAMTNMVWCNPGSLWIELAESSYYPPFYRGLAESCGIRYKAVLTESGPHHKANVAANISVDLDKLSKMMNEVMG